ncbi:unnamed protein product [Adineta ricciae]|uniref:RAI1-like domain-containing protein n=1 Tax=Adineta ricciae TaxID=249248 RepID=A0A814VRY6_ADIRI|nr:unnamed protein product [Adineta ricciae]CAF1194813.1 unnamed protein product [Adineta ricciae]
MDAKLHHKERKIVPRFRRKNANNNLIDADDAEAQALIDKELESHYVWTSDTINEDFKHQFDNYQSEENNQQISIRDEIYQNQLYDINDGENEDLWKKKVELDENYEVKWSDDQQEREIQFNIHSIQDKQQQWSLDNQNHERIQLNLFDKHQLKNKHDLETDDPNQEQNFIQGEEFRNQMKFAIESQLNDLNLFPENNEDLRSTIIDPSLPIIDTKLSCDQEAIILEWVEGTSEYQLSLPVEKLAEEYSPQNDKQVEIDSKNLKALHWSLDLLKENLILSYLISLPSNDREQLSIPEDLQVKLSIDDEKNLQIFSLNDSIFCQTISLSSNDLKQQLLTIIDSIQMKQNFGIDEQNSICQWSLNDLKIFIQNLSPNEILHHLYSPEDATSISLEQILIESDEISARAFRRYRCKHMSIKSEEKQQFDSTQSSHLEFKGNETIAIGEEQIQNDFDDEQQSFKDITTCEILLNENISQSYDIQASESSPIKLGPCLFRSDYEREPPKTWSRLRREIGYISYDASLAQPTYHLDKSFKRYVHIPKQRTQCSYNVYRGYQEFKEKARLNPENYFRPHDGTDLRPLLSWYSQKQHLFSKTNSTLLKPPTFICRRLVLRTILANLYCDSDPWKLLVVRIKGQFYLAIANKAKRHVENMTEDEYSGYKFEQLFTTQQPNTTRFEEQIPLDKPQEQFHTVQYWRFGEFNILYSNEIDGEIHQDMIPKQTDESVKVNLTQSTENEEEEEESEDVVEDETKVAQINENLEVVQTDENETVDKKKRFENEIKAGYVEMKCTNKKIFYRDENKLQTLFWWAQMWLANVNTLMIGYKSSNDGTINQIDLFSIQKLIWKFLSRYDLHLKYCLSYLYSFLQLIQQTIHIDDPNTIHAFAYIPQPLEIDPLTGEAVQVDLPQCVPFRYTQIKRSNQRHANLMPEWYLQETLRAIPIRGTINEKTIEQEMKKRIGHRGRASCTLKQEENHEKKRPKKRK